MPLCANPKKPSTTGRTQASRPIRHTGLNNVSPKQFHALTTSFSGHSGIPKTPEGAIDHARQVITGHLFDLRDDVYRIASEAVRNAFQHAQATRIEAEIRHDPRKLRLRIRDDGKGIDPEVLEAGGGAGHYGLPGLHERAKLVGG